MPTLLELLNSRREEIYQGQNIGGGEKESQINKNEGEMKREFKNRQDTFRNRELYGIQGTALIESRGLINPARIAALAVSSPSPVADLIGSQLNGFLGGNANKPDDTIFKNKKVFSKPITLLAPTQALQRDAVKEGEIYYIKSSPFPGNILKNFISAFKNPTAFISMGAMALNKFGSKGAIKRLGELLKRKGDAPGYGPRFGQQIGRGKDKAWADREYVKYSTHYTLFTPKKALEGSKSATGKLIYSRESDEKAEVKKRDNTAMSEGSSQFDLINDTILSSPDVDFETSDKTESTIFEKFLKKNGIKRQPGYVYVAIRPYGKKGKALILPGTISGISEDYSPDIASFKYVGSPFSLYRYNGVERTLKFDLKLYALDPKHEVNLRNNLNSLRRLVYPDDELSVVTYAGDTAYAPLYFNTSLVQLTVYGLYSDLLCIVDSLSISVEDTVPWVTNDYISIDGSQDLPHPSVFNVSLGFKVINNPSVKKEDGSANYSYNSSTVEGNKYNDFFTGITPEVNGYSNKEDIKVIYAENEKRRKEAEEAAKLEKKRGRKKE